MKFHSKLFTPTQKFILAIVHICVCVPVTFTFAQSPATDQLTGLLGPLTNRVENRSLLGPYHLAVTPALSHPLSEQVVLKVELRDSVDPVLQGKLTALVAGRAWAKAVREKRFAAALVDITDLQTPRLATINGDVMIYAASLPKIAILLGVFQSVADGDLVLDGALKKKATRMIRNSSNKAATELYNAVGPENLADILQSERYQLYNPEWGGGLWVGKPYAKKKVWRRDPIANLSHGATAFQVARYYYLLETGQLVSHESSAAMKEIFGNPAINHKFVRGLRKERPGSKIFRKSGTWRTYHADGGIIERDGRRYIAVVLANDLSGSAWLSKLIVAFDDLIFKDEHEVLN